MYILFNSMKMSIKADFDLNTGIHEVLNINVPGVENPEVEEYLMGNKIYVKSHDGQWSYMTVPGLSTLKELQNLQLQNNLFDKNVLYRYAGTTFIIIIQLI